MINQSTSSSSTSSAPAANCWATRYVAPQPKHQEQLELKEIKIADADIESLLPKSKPSTNAYNPKKLATFTYEVEINPELLRALRYLREPEKELQAEKILLLLAEKQKSSIAANLLGDYYFAKGNPQSYLSAVKWYLHAATQNNVNGCYGLGKCFYFGFGVPIFYDQAYQWFLKAAKKHHPLAQYALFLCYKNGDGVALDQNQAIIWLKAAVTNGFSRREAQLALGRYYGANQNFVTALKLFKVAYAKKITTATLDNILECYFQLVRQAATVAQQHNIILELLPWHQRELENSIKAFEKESAIKPAEAQKSTPDSKESKQITSPAAVTLDDLKTFADCYFKIRKTYPIKFRDIVLKALYEYCTNAKQNKLSAALDQAQLVMLNSNILELVGNEEIELHNAATALQTKIAATFSFNLLTFSKFFASNHSFELRRQDFSTKLDPLAATQILSFLDLADIQALTQTNKFWHHMINKFEIRTKICNELHLLACSQRFANYNNNKFYTIHVFIALTIMLLVWCAQKDNNPNWLRISAGLFLLSLIGVEKKVYTFHQEYKKLGLIKNPATPGLHVTINQANTILRKLHDHIAAIAIEYSNDVVPDDILSDLIIRLNQSESFITIKTLAQQFSSWVSILKQMIPANKINLLSPIDQNDLGLLLYINNELMPQIESYVDIVLYWIKGIKSHPIVIEALSSSSSTRTNSNTALQNIWRNFINAVLHLNDFFPELKNTSLRVSFGKNS